MPRGVKIRVKVDDEERLELERLVRSPSSSQGMVVRANIILQSSKKNSNRRVADSLGVSVDTVTQWTQRWEHCQKNGEPTLSRLLDLPRSGRPSEIEPEQLCKLVALACESPEVYGRPITHWTQRELADEAIKQGIFDSISERHLGRLLKELKLKPHRSQYWLNAKADPKKEEKIAAICEIYKDAEIKKKRIFTQSALMKRQVCRL